jgi:hypothetical protein
MLIKGINFRVSSSGGAACFKEKGRGKQEKALGASKRKRTD